MKELERKIDALVAEHVMGWKFIGGFSLDPELNMDRWAVDPDGHEKYHVDVPCYSTDIAEAWKVVDILTKDEVSIEITYGSESRSVLFLCLNTMTIFGHSFHTSLPMAICLAALEVKKAPSLVVVGSVK